MKKRVLQLLAVAVLVLSLVAFDSITHNFGWHLQPQTQGSGVASALAGLSIITGAAVVADSPRCGQEAPCAFPSGWKCVSNSKCYDYSDCVVRCPSSSTPSQPEEKKEEPKSKCYDYNECIRMCPSSSQSEQQSALECICSDWQTIGFCGKQDCPLSQVPQLRSCTGGSACKSENRCLELAQCASSKEEKPSAEACTCSDWQTSGGCGQQDCPQDKIPQYRSCTGGSSCKTENRCLDSECPEAAKAVTPEGVNLVPELVISPSEGLKSGDTIEVTLYVKNAGTRNAHYNDIKDGGTSINNLVYFYAEKEYGPKVIPSIHAPVSLLTLPGGAIKQGEDGKVQAAKQTVKIPEDFAGNLVIVAAIDTQSVYPEANENDNRPTKIILVREAALPNLVATAADAVPSLEKLPVTLSYVEIKVQNTGELDAVAEKQFLENSVTVKKGNTEICSGYSSNLLTIKPGMFATGLPAIIRVNALGGHPCVINDKDANYWAVVNVDSLSAVKESDEENEFTFMLKEGPQTCKTPRGRELGKYCSIGTGGTGTWLPQKTPGEPCSNNFECNVELCVRSKCMTEAQKEQILRIVS